MEPDIIIRIRFLSTSEGGRSSSVEGRFYGCPMFVDNEGFDCRLILDGRCLDLGFTYDVPVKFLSRERAISKLSVGKEVLLWEGRCVAKGQVVKIFDES